MAPVPVLSITHVGPLSIARSVAVSWMNGTCLFNANCRHRPVSAVQSPLTSTILMLRGRCRSFAGNAVLRSRSPSIRRGVRRTVNTSPSGRSYPGAGHISSSTFPRCEDLLSGADVGRLWTRILAILSVRLSGFSRCRYLPVSTAAKTGAQTPLPRDRPPYPQFPGERVRGTSCEACESRL
jgi:hypothetical protein